MVMRSSLEKFLLILLFASLCPTLFAQPADTVRRKKVAVVLSGGGAKGMAHIGALRVIEKAGIPIDIITGTSMGALVGGLYAIGYDSHKLDSLVHVQDWGFLLSDKAGMNRQSIDERRKQNTYFLSRAFSLSKKKKFQSGGFIEGKNLMSLFSKLTANYIDSINFNKLPIPFACVATNIVDNTEVVWQEGVLAKAMRSSMSIPGVFAPVREGDKMLVDGGLRNNFPVDIARKMGADVVIGVTVQGEPKTADDLENGSSILGQIVDVNCMNKYEANMQATDILIRCDTKGYTAASFTKKAIDTLIVRGEQEAMKHWDSLMSLKRELGLPNDYMPKKPASAKVVGLPQTMRLRKVLFENMEEKDIAFLTKKYKLKNKQFITLNEVDDMVATLRVNLFYTDADSYFTPIPNENDLYDVKIVAKEKKQSRVGLGIRFDTEEMVALQANGTLRFNTKMPLDIDLSLRLGKRIMVKGNLNITPWTYGRMTLSYTYRHNDINIYDNGNRLSNALYDQHRGTFHLFDFNIRNFNVKIGTRFDYINYNDLLVGINYEGNNQPRKNLHFMDYHATVDYNSENGWNFPTKGARFHADYRYVTKNFVDYDGHVGFNIVEASWRMNFPLNNHLTFQPMIYGRMLTGKKGKTLNTTEDFSAGRMTDLTLFHLQNFIGGAWFGHYLEEQQMPFAGVGHVEMVENKWIAIQLKLQQQIADNNYLIFRLGTYEDGHDLNNLFDHSPKVGMEVGYFYNLKFLGPLGASLGYSDKTHKPYFYINFGFEF